MTSRSPIEIELSGWKTIAAHLGVSVREAQSWEKDAGMPVRRMPGKKSRVWARRDELDAWKEQVSVSDASKQRDLTNVGEDQGNTPGRDFMSKHPSGGRAWRTNGADFAAGADASAGARRRSPFLRRFRALASLAIAGVVLASFGVLAYHNRSMRVASVAINGDTLIARGITGNLLWTYPFDGALRDTTSDEWNWRTQVVDLNGDGDREVLFAAGFVNPQGLYGREEVFCFSSRGKLLWRYRPETQMEFNKRALNGPWAIRQMIVVDESSAKAIWIAVFHTVWWPSFVVKISPDGRHEMMFTSSGSIYSLFSVRTKAGSYILAGGINNEYRMASVAVLKANGPPATSPQSNGTQYQCIHGCPSGPPYRYILLPRSELNAAGDVPYNWTVGIYARPGGITIDTRELPVTRQLFDLSGEFLPERVAYSSDYAETHRRYEKEGRIGHSFDLCPERRNPAVVRVFDENGISRLVSVPRVQ